MTNQLHKRTLDFKECVIVDINYGKGETEIGRAAKRR